MRLIDADVLRTSIEKDRDASDMPKMWYEGIEYAINHIIHAPTADVVEVVRCRDCKWYKTNYSWNGTEHKVCVIEAYEPLRKECDFCSRGERKETENEEIHNR